MNGGIRRKNIRRDDSGHLLVKALRAFSCCAVRNGEQLERSRSMSQGALRGLYL